MLITSDDIRKLRPIANNIDDISRIEPYINDAEKLDILPSITAAIYKALDTTDWDNTESVVIINDNNERVEFTKEQHTLLMDGGYYTTNTENYCGGLKQAIGYLAYARLLHNINVNVTPFGTKIKLSDLSETTDNQDLSRVANEAKSIGLEYLSQCTALLSFYHLIITIPEKKRFTKFKAIG